MIVVLIVSTLVVGIPLPLGVVGHEGSTVIVVLNGLRLLRGNLQSQPAPTNPIQTDSVAIGAFPTSGR